MTNIETATLVMAALAIGYLEGRARFIRKADNHIADVLDGADKWPAWLKPAAFLIIFARFPIITTRGTWRYLRTGTVHPRKPDHG